MAGSIRCDRCGGRATLRATQKKEKREILLCDRHRDEHMDALKHQKFEIEDIQPWPEKEKVEPEPELTPV